MGKETENWEYVSGRCAGLENALLEKNFFPELMRADDLSEAFVLISRTAYGPVFPEAMALPDYDRRLREHLSRGLESIRDDSPSPAVAQLFLRSLELEEVHYLLAEKSRSGSSPEELGGWVGRLSGGFDWMKGFYLAELPDRLFRLHPVRAVSLWMDAAFLLGLLNLSEKQAEFRPYVEAQISLSSLEVCFRALNSGLGFEWLDAFFFRDALRKRFHPNPAALPRGDLNDLFLAMAPPGFHITRESFTREFSRAADDYLTGVAEIGRYQASGPSRVLYYLRRLWVETCNLRLSLAAVLVPLDRSQVEARLRYG